MTSFSATGTNGALGKGNGGDVSAEFENGRYDIDFDDDEPIAQWSDAVVELAAAARHAERYGHTGAAFWLARRNPSAE